MLPCEKLRILRQKLDSNDTTTDEVANAYLANAGRIVVNLAFPFGTGNEVVPDKYAYEQIEIALYLLNKRGAEGEISHSEGGISRTYEAADIPVSLRSRITPRVGGF